MGSIRKVEFQEPNECGRFREKMSSIVKCLKVRNSTPVESPQSKTNSVEGLWKDYKFELVK